MTNVLLMRPAAPCVYSLGVLFALLASLPPGTLAQSSSTTTTAPPSTTPEPSIGTVVVLRVKINGVLTNITDCTFSLTDGINCTSNLQHDVSVTPLGTSGTESWVTAMIVINSVLIVVIMGVAIGSYFYVKKTVLPAAGQYEPVPGSAGYGYPANYGEPPPPPGYQYATNTRIDKKVIGVELVRPSLLPPDAIMA